MNPTGRTLKDMPRPWDRPVPLGFTVSPSHQPPNPTPPRCCPLPTPQVTTTTFESVLFFFHFSHPHEIQEALQATNFAVLHDHRRQTRTTSKEIFPTACPLQSIESKRRFRLPPNPRRHGILEITFQPRMVGQIERYDNRSLRRRGVWFWWVVDEFGQPVPSVGLDWF